ncbi:uncharacterized protein [Dendrobates tinctorius]|uniref:uncharacterized protein isoform X1 n=1 Tax=Dendrobates tinctorius TaxID=92724 RepID=UPI003CC9E003
MVQNFLGLTIDSVMQECRLPEEKEEKIKNLIRTTLGKPTMTLRKAMSVLGSLTSCIPAVKWAQLHTRELQWCVLQNDLTLQGQLEQKLTIPDPVLQSLKWWLQIESSPRGVPWTYAASRVVTTDASPWGWGAHLDTLWLQDPWARGEKDLSSNEWELLAIERALERLLTHLRGHHVKVLSDNRTAVAYVNHQGGTRSRSLMEIAKRILTLAEHQFLSLSALHIRGADNLKADFLSRNHLGTILLALRVHFSASCAEVGKTHNRSLRLKNQQESSKILLPKTSRHATGSRRLQNKMDIRSPIRLPSNMPHSISPEKNQGGSSQSNYDSSLLAKKAVVLLAEGDVSDRPMGAPRGSRPPNTGSLQSSSEFQAAFDSLEFERSLLEKKGFSARLISTLISSGKPVTTKMYGRIWRKFSSTSGPIQEGEVPVRAVLEFLQKGLDLGLAVSTLKVHVSALAALFNYDLASDRWVVRFIRACARADSVPSPKPPPWDLNLVLSSLTESPFEPIDATSESGNFKNSPVSGAHIGT